MATGDTRYNTLSAAVRYDEKIRHKRRLSNWLEMSMVRRSLTDVVGNRILDCPCGTGRIDGLLRERFSDIVGVDNAEPMLEVYKATNTDRVAQLADVFELPFVDDEFDWVVAHRLFHHFHTDEQRLRFLESISRVARSGVTFYAWLETPLSRRGSEHERGRRSVPLSQLEQLLKKTSLELIKIHKAAWPFSPKVMVSCRVVS